MLGFVMVPGLTSGFISRPVLLDGHDGIEHLAGGIDPHVVPDGVHTRLFHHEAIVRISTVDDFVAANSP